MSTATMSTKETREIATERDARLREEQGAGSPPVSYATWQQMMADMKQMADELRQAREALQQQRLNPGSVGLTPAAVAASTVLDAHVAEQDQEKTKRLLLAQPRRTVRLDPNDQEKAIMKRRIHALPPDAPTPPWPRRWFMVNGVYCGITVGSVVQVPETIAAIVDECSQESWINLRPARRSDGFDPAAVGIFDSDTFLG